MSICASVHAFVIILSILVFAITVFFSATAASASSDGIFLSTTKNISAKFFLEVTPDKWTFSVWVIIYSWNGLWLVYSLSTLFRRNKLGPVFCKPDILPIEFYIIWCCSNLFHIAWLILWDREYITVAMIFYALIPYTCYMMLAISHQNCYKHGLWLSLYSPWDLWSIRLLVHNGLAAYATWTSITTAITFGTVLKYKAGSEDSGISTAVLCSLFYELILWFLLENLIFERYVRYTFTVYPVAILAMAGILTKNTKFDERNTNQVFTVVLLATSVIAFVIRFLSALCCGKFRPLYPSENPYTSNKSMKSTTHFSSVDQDVHISSATDNTAFEEDNDQLSRVERTIPV
ncbi:uncharacterized protein LOC122798300 [Protopterus annectens]|uniref:uncharacterized protein LOC122798300 n=1 Tax=Protopterus annectens TaxID=7888 RepID=UPI001CFAEEEE|nr:uncharacterized protein LOC122798300 [Protopterus annectens]